MPSILQNASSGDAPTSRVMVLLNMVTPEELYSDNDYNDIVEDINDECGKYGEVEGVRIPRPIPKSKKWEPSDSAAATVEKNRKADEQAGVGRVYVMYKQIESIGKAMKAIGGRQFGGRTILVASVPEVRLRVIGVGRALTIRVGRVPRSGAAATTSRGLGCSSRRCRQGYHGGSPMIVSPSGFPIRDVQSMHRDISARCESRSSSTALGRRALLLVRAQIPARRHVHVFGRDLLILGFLLADQSFRFARGHTS